MAKHISDHGAGGFSNFDTLSDAMQFYMPIFIDLVSITNLSIKLIYVTCIKANQAYVAIVTIYITN